MRCKKKKKWKEKKPHGFQGIQASYSAYGRRLVLTDHSCILFLSAVVLTAKSFITQVVNELLLILINFNLRDFSLD